LSIHVAGVIGLVLVFVIGTLRPINLGAISLVMTFLIGTIFRRESLTDLTAGFPVDLFVLLVGVTYLFAVAANNGSVDRVVAAAAGLVKRRRALVPWIVFVAAALPAMAGALGSAGVALLAPLSMRLGRRYGIDRRMIGLMVVHGAASGNFSPLNVLGIIVKQGIARYGLEMSSSALFIGNLAYNLLLGAVIYLVFGGPRLVRQEIRRKPGTNSLTPAPVDAAGVAPIGIVEVESSPAADGVTTGCVEEYEPEENHPGRMRMDQWCTLSVILGVAVASLVFGMNIGFLAFAAAVVLQLLFPKSSGEAEKRIAWSVVLLVCGIVTYVGALQRYGTVEAIGGGIARLGSPLATGLLICAVGAVTSAFASSAGILGAMIPLAIPLVTQGGVGTTGMVVALAISATAVDATPFSTVGALVVANADEDERPRIYRGLLLWGAAMVITAPLLTWLIFIVLAG
jgi:Na+/H+ antiporter NhaD/arsenite permease-like protein